MKTGTTALQAANVYVNTHRFAADPQDEGLEASLKHLAFGAFAEGAAWALEASASLMETERDGLWLAEKIRALKNGDTQPMWAEAKAQETPNLTMEELAKGDKE